MFTPSLSATALFSLSLLVPGYVRAQDDGLPEGAMQPRARAACTLCHDARIIVQQRLTKELWSKEVDKMVKWGALLNSSDRDAMIDYLSTNFPPEKPAYVAPRSRAQTKRTAKRPRA